MNRRYVKRLLSYGIIVSCSLVSIPLLLSKNDDDEGNQHSFFLWNLENENNYKKTDETPNVIESTETRLPISSLNRIPQQAEFLIETTIPPDAVAQEVHQLQRNTPPEVVEDTPAPTPAAVQRNVPAEAIDDTPVQRDVSPQADNTAVQRDVSPQADDAPVQRDVSPEADDAPAQQNASPASPVTTKEAPAAIPPQTTVTPPETPTIPATVTPTEPATAPDTPALEITPITEPESEGTLPQTTSDIEEEPTPPVPAVPPSPTTSTAEELLERRSKAITINFTNVSDVEMVRFVSRITNRNFIFDEVDLQFTVTIVSEEPASVDTIMTAFLQELRVHGLSVLEQNNTFIIHRNPDVKAVGKVETVTPSGPQTAEVITRLFLLNTLDPDKAASIVRPMVSTQALVEASKDTRHLIVTDIASNIEQIAELIRGLDSPSTGLNIGQYVVKNTFIGTLVELTEKLMRPIVQDQHFVMVPHAGANSIFIVSTPFLVDRTISLMQRLDQIQGTTGAYGLEDLKFKEKVVAPDDTRQGQWELDERGNWIFRPTGELSIDRVGEGELPRGQWLLDSEGNWYFQPDGAQRLEGAISHEGVTTKEAPKGYWRKDANGNWIFELGAGETISAQALTRIPQIAPELPLGHVERTRFYIHKLRYRRGEQIVRALLRVGESLLLSGISNEELVAAINSIQWIESSNVLVLTGTIDTIDKMRELINEIDIPLRQVFIEMLLLETTIDDSLRYGVQWSVHSGGGLTSTNENFITAGSTLPTGMATTLGGGLPNANPLTPTEGFAAGIIGTALSHNGTIFHSIGALVEAIHNNTKINILLNPKLLVEDNATAEIFVGINTQFQTQSIVNEQGSIVTNNFEFRDVGTRFKVTPIIGPDGLVTMDVEEEVSDIAPITTGLAAVAGAGTLGLAQIQPGPTTRKSKSVTKVHVPNGYFMVFSGMIQDSFLHRRENLPCLGGLPYIGALFAHKNNNHTKRNLIIFLRPIIVDTDEQIDNITKHQQDIHKIYRHNKSMWKYEVEEGLDFLNLKTTDCENDCPDPA